MVKNRHSFRVIYGDTDAMGIVYYANYLRYFEAGRAELLRAIGVPYAELEAEGLKLPVAEAHVKYHAPAMFDDLLSLETEVSEVRHVSARIRYQLVRERDQVLIASGETKHACVAANGRPTKLPERLKTALGA